jgi:uncharacterized protein DUF3108
VVLRLVLTGLFLFAAQGAQAAEKLVYDIRTNGFRFGELTVDYEATGQTYQVEVVADAQGLFGLLLRSRYTGRSTGVLGGGVTPLPDHFSASSRRIFKSRVADVWFEGQRPNRVSIRPARDKTPMSDPRKVKVTVIDPLTYLGQIVGMSTPDCPKTRALYDRRRQTRVSFMKTGTSAIEFTCTGSYEIVNGPPHSLQPKFRSFGLDLKYRQNGAADYRLIRVVFRSGSNEVVLNLLGGQG